MQSKFILSLAGMLLFLGMALTLGCQSTSTFFVGEKVKNPNLLVPLSANKQQSGTWQTFDLIINYSIEKGQDSLTLAGQAQFTQHYRTVYNRVRRMDLFLLFLDEESRVLKTVKLPTFFTRIEDVSPIRTTQPLPSGTRAISFAYSGVVRGEGEYFPFSLRPTPG